MKKILVMLCLLSSYAFAAKLKDVDVLDGVMNKDGFELKLQAKEGQKDAYFFVNVAKNDRGSFDKLALVIQKLKQMERFKLMLDIPSFSESPPGSYYHSKRVSFSGKKI